VFALLLRAAAQTPLTLGHDPQRLGAELGITAVLHTWTRQLEFHPPAGRLGDIARCRDRRARHQQTAYSTGQQTLPPGRYRWYGSRMRALPPATEVVFPVMAMLALATPLVANAGRLNATDACLARRLDAAGAACRSTIDAGASAIRSGNDGRRDRRIDRAQASLARAWAAAGRRAERQGASCGEFSPDAERVGRRIADFATVHAEAVASGLSPTSRPAHRRCASRLLRTASRFCGAVLAGEATRRRQLAAHPDASADTPAVQRARTRLHAAVDRLDGNACPTGLDADEVERAVAGVGLGIAVSLTRPNILWLVAEDMNLELRVYDDPVARTPTLDALAAAGTRFTHAFATSGVCAPARAALITGMYATSIGAHHMRSIEGGYYPVPPPEVKAFPEYLRAAGYYTSNAAKEDYQFSGVFGGGPFTIWDASGPSANWRGRAAGQPFFAFVTFFITHESQLFHDDEPETDPADVRVPAYYPATPVIRRDLAQHYDNVAAMDAQVADVLARLEEDGIADDTLVLFLGDNGRGMPRDKRWVYDGGIHVALVARWPGKIAPGTVRTDLVSFVDLAPTMLALAGIDVPAHMQGRVFLGRQAAEPPPYVFAAADRSDEAVDRIRAVRDGRYKYIRNYQPGTPYGQAIAFRNLLQSMQEILQLGAIDALVPPTDWYFRQTKPIEELYDVVADPDEVVDLAGSPVHIDILAAMRQAHDAWVVETGDLGAVPEAELAERFWPGGLQPVTAPPSIEPAGGEFAGAITVALRSATDGASIGYTLDPGDDAHWLPYTGPIGLDGPGTVRARAIRYGFAESAETRATFTTACMQSRRSTCPLHVEDAPGSRRPRPTASNVEGASGAPWEDPIDLRTRRTRASRESAAPRRMDRGVAPTPAGSASVESR
jgi:arylsulfatase A-like enzyme